MGISNSRNLCQSNRLRVPIARKKRLKLPGRVILGVAQTVGAQLDPGWNLLAGHIAFLVVLALRPEGLFPKVQG